MKSFTLFSLMLVVVCMASTVIAMNQTPVDRGKALFNDPKLGGGTSGNSCNTCHPDGKGLAGASTKMAWKTPGGAFKTLEDASTSALPWRLKVQPLM